MILRILSLLLAGCVAAARAGSTPDSPSAQIYDRATNEFACANFIKPAEPPNPDASFRLAPLIIQETLAADPVKDGFGALSMSNGIVVLDRSSPTVYVHADQVEIREKPHLRFTYLWCYSADNPARDNQTLGIQGVRITADSAGSPVIWEVLADESGLDLVFAAESLEAAAKNQWGKAQSGRRFALEAARRKAPRTVVARVIADGPVPMGPIVYLQRNSRNVSTLVCRCMPAQAKSLLTSSVYHLKPIQAENSDLLLQMLRDRLKLRAAFWPGAKDVPGIEKKLRLPKNF
jgi:hypothetical protein